VDLVFNDEQDELRRVVRRFLEQRSSERDVRRLMESAEGYDASVWKQMADGLGLHGLAIPEEYGGSGYSFVELIVVLEEMGRALLCAPFFSSVVLAASLLLAAGDERAKRDYLPGIAAGSTIATVALAEESGQWHEAGINATAARSGESWTLNGQKSYVMDGHVAGLLFVAARTGAGVGIFAVDSGAAGLTTTRLSTLDQTRKLARLDLADTPARLVGRDGQGWPAWARMLDTAAVALAAEQVGGAQRVLDMSVEYAKIRVQFGRPIGSFQAIKHKCADMLLDVESAKSAAYYAAWSVAADTDEVPVVASLAKSYCSEAYSRAVAENIQIHGGIGFTWEHPAHLYFRRARSSEAMFGTPSYHRELFAQRIGV
jgi:alkylation response protein AidB-like acyl-CoA dehydrogenase